MIDRPTPGALQHLRCEHARVAFYIAGGGPVSWNAFHYAELGEELLGFAAFIVVRADDSSSLAQRCRV